MQVLKKAGGVMERLKTYKELEIIIRELFKEFKELYNCREKYRKMYKV